MKTAQTLRRFFPHRAQTMLWLIYDLFYPTCSLHWQWTWQQLLSDFFQCCLIRHLKRFHVYEMDCSHAISIFIYYSIESSLWWCTDWCKKLPYKWRFSDLMREMRTDCEYVSEKARQRKSANVNQGKLYNLINKTKIAFYVFIVCFFNTDEI